jgi:hypothetical protein
LDKAMTCEAPVKHVDSTSMDVQVDVQR